jgi:hypothetical protein
MENREEGQAPVPADVGRKRCEHLFCHERPVARLTVPHHKAQYFVCEMHLAEKLVWAEPYRKVIGMVSVERLERAP